MSWILKCQKLIEEANSNSMVMLDLCAQIHGNTNFLHNDAGLSEEEARDKHNRIASLRDQLDQVLPRINAIARTARNIL